MKIVRIALTEVVVPARPDSVASPEVDHPLHMLSCEGKKGWSVQFDKMPKFIIQLYTNTPYFPDGSVHFGMQFAPTL